MPFKLPVSDVLFDMSDWILQVEIFFFAIIASSHVNGLIVLNMLKCSFRDF